MKIKSMSVGLLLLIFSGTAFAFNPVGSYSYSEKGLSGKMSVTESGGVPNRYLFKIFTATKDGSTCDVDGVEFDRISSPSVIESMVSPEAAPGEKVSKFSVKFTPKDARIEIIEFSSSDCGVSGSYSGKWKKVKK